MFLSNLTGERDCMCKYKSTRSDFSCANYCYDNTKKKASDFLFFIETNRLNFDVTNTILQCTVWYQHNKSFPVYRPNNCVLGPSYFWYDSFRFWFCVISCFGWTIAYSLHHICCHRWLLHFSAWSTNQNYSIFSRPTLIMHIFERARSFEYVSYPNTWLFISLPKSSQTLVCIPAEIAKHTHKNKKTNTATTTTNLDVAN